MNLSNFTKSHDDVIDTSELAKRLSLTEIAPFSNFARNGKFPVISNQSAKTCAIAGATFLPLSKALK